MGGRWNNASTLSRLSFIFLACLALGSQNCWSLNDDGLPLLESRARVQSESRGISPGCANRKLGHSIRQNTLKQLSQEEPLVSIREAFECYRNYLSQKNFGPGVLDTTYCGSSSYQVAGPSEENNARRKLAEESRNLAAAPATTKPNLDPVASTATTHRSGALPAVAHGENAQKLPTSSVSPNASKPLSVNTSIESRSKTFQSIRKYIIMASSACAALIVGVIVFFICRNKKVKVVSPWKSGLSGKLQKAFVTGVPKLNRAELDTACEDFSNIIITFDGCTVYKGTLSNGVEIAVACTTVSSASNWTKNSEKIYRKKIETLSRVNHKNFVNLLGYCAEDEPFNRMMVFEYAPNGSLFEYLHGLKEMEHLDWNARVRISMGTAYCLQNMHELKPPVALPQLNSSVVFMTDDYAAKIVDVSFWKTFLQNANMSSDSSHIQDVSSKNSSKHSGSLSPDTETNVFSFGLLLLEIISGKFPHSDEYDSIVNWASEHLRDKESFSNLVDPTLKSFKSDELNQMCDVIMDCIQPEPKKRPTMKQVITKLREVISISPDAATPRLSPLWWAELEILSTDAS